MWSALGRALFYAAIGTGVVFVVVRFWPDDLEPDVEDTARNVVWIVLAVLALALLWFVGVALVHFLRWRRAVRWERMLRRSVDRRARAADRDPRRRRARRARRAQGRRPTGRHVAARRRRRHLRRAGAARCRHAARVGRRRGDRSLRRRARRRSGAGRRRRGVAVVPEVADRPRRGAAVRGRRPHRCASARRRHLGAAGGGDPAARRDHAHHRAGQGEHQADHGGHQLVRRPAAIHPLPAPVRQRAGDRLGSWPGRGGSTATSTSCAAPPR